MLSQSHFQCNAGRLTKKTLWNLTVLILAISDNYKDLLQFQLLACSTERGGYMGSWYSGWIVFRWKVLKLPTVITVREEKELSLLFCFFPRIFHIYDIFFK